MTSLLFLALVHASPFDHASASDLLDMVNAYRAAHNIDPLKLDDSLCQVAGGHAAYMSANHLLSHHQAPNAQNFTGANLAERAARIDWKDELSELVGYANTNLGDAIQAIFDSPCHRSRFLKPGKLTLGASADGQYVCLLIGGESNRTAVISPPPSATDVPTTWFGSRDFSGTMSGPGGAKYGYPIVYVADGKQLTVRHTSLADSSGTLVDTIVRDQSNDSHYVDAMTVIPKTPLKPGQSYTVTLDVTIDGNDRTVTSTFTTQSNSKPNSYSMNKQQ